MKITNRRGIAELAILVTVLVTLAVAPYLQSAFKIFGLGGSQQTTKTERVIQKTTVEPYLENGKPVHTVLPDGTNAILMRTTSSNQTEDSNAPVPMTFIQKLLVLPKLWLGLMVLGVFFAPVGTFMAWFNSRVKGKLEDLTDHHEQVMTDAKKIVTGIDRAFQAIPQTLVGLPGEINREHLAALIVERMKGELSRTYNDSTKTLVANLKRD